MNQKFIAILTCLTAAFHSGPLQAVADDEPNVLIIQTDEHNFRTLGCYRALVPREQAFIWGSGVAVETPHIDSLAKRGALCDRLYAASPVCTPSRASFVTGRYGTHAKSVIPELTKIAEYFAEDEKDFPKELTIMKAKCIRESITAIEASTDTRELIILK